MPKPRKSQISLPDTHYYHCISRCVRRAFLCGEDKQTQQSYEHRRQWVKDKIAFLPQVFAIEVCAYAIMSNHTHLVLHVNEQAATNWDTTEVLTRWHKLFKGTLLTQKYLSKVNHSNELDNNSTIESPQLSQSERLTIEQTAQVYKQRLMDISWFMRVLNEGIARQANKEDECTGRFWEGRFKCQALLDEAALLSCMAYVDLNPVRAKAAATPETSDFTSIQERIKQIVHNKDINISQPTSKLMPFSDNGKADNDKIETSNELLFKLSEYIELIETTGRCIREDKVGHIDNQLPELLTRLNISSDNWLTITKQFTKVFHGAVGNEHVLQNFSERKQLKRRPNVSSCQRLLA